nr:MAG TPA_asm: hypothetical protein [Bacteriophage sp.]
MLANKINKPPYLRGFSFDLRDFNLFGYNYTIFIFSLSLAYRIKRDNKKELD